MWHGIFALFLRSMRSDARSLVVHLSWSLLVVGVYVGNTAVERSMSGGKCRLRLDPVMVVLVKRRAQQVECNHQN